MRTQIDTPGDLVVHPCFRSPVFIRYVVAIAGVGILPLFLVLLGSGAQWIDHAAPSGAGFLGQVSKVIMNAAAVSGIGLLPAYGLIILFAFLTPALYPRERIAIVLIAGFFVIGILAIIMTIVLWFL